MIHNKQLEIIKQAKTFFPNYSLKDWSKNTGIQITRIFRLFKGSEMSISEFYRFQELLNKDDHFEKEEKIRNDFESIHHRLSRCLPKKTIQLLNAQLNFHLENYELLNATHEVYLNNTMEEK